MISFSRDQFEYWLKAIFSLVLLVLLFSPAVADKLAVDDKVRFEFMGKSREGVVVDFTGTGWPIIKFKYDGRVRERFFPTDNVRRIGNAKSFRTKSPAKTRKWSSRSGNFDVKAVLLSVDDNAVRLKKEDGRVITVPIDKLSNRDQGYIDAMRDVISGNSDEKEEDEEGLFAGGVMEGDSEEQPRGSLDAFDPYDLPAIDIHTAETIPLRSKSGWPIEPDAMPLNPPTFERAVGINREDSKESAFHDKVQCVLSRNGTIAALSISNPFGDQTSIRLIDLSKREEIARVLLSGKESVLAVKDGGKQVVTGKSPHSQVVDHVAYWEPVDGELKPTGGWKRGGRSRFGSTTARFLSDDRMIVSSGNTAALWDSKKAQSIYSIKFDSQPALSANRQQIALVGENGNIYIVLAGSGKLITEIESPEKRISQLAFSDDGTKLAGYGYGHLLVWDLNDGSPLTETWLLWSPSRGDLFWAGDQFLFVGGTTLVDTHSGVAAWTYHGSEFIAKGSGNQFWAMDWHEGGGSMIPFLLPSSSVVEACGEIDLDKLIWIEPGPVSLEIKGMGDSDSEVRKALTEQLTKLGYTIQGNADMAVKVWLEKGKTQTTKVRDWFRGPFGNSDETITFTPSKGKYEVSYQGHVISAATSNEFTVPRTLRLGTNENAQQAANRYCRPDVDFFERIRFPRKGPLLPDGKQSFGSSTLARDGWR